MSARVHAFPRSRQLSPDAERATWCMNCRMVARSGDGPLLEVNSCSRCETYDTLTWRVVGWWALFASAVWAFAIWAAL